MRAPILVISDIHFHNWSAFSGYTEDGVNTRLQNIIDAFEEAVEHLLSVGGYNCFIGGDLFHVRGKISPTVMNPVRDMFDRLTSKGATFSIIPGNHDLETDDTSVIGNSLNSIKMDNVHIIESPMCLDDEVWMFPWRHKLSDLLDDMKNIVDKTDVSDQIAIIHAPLNDVIYGIPDHGLDPETLKAFGFEAVFCGHYHNAKNFDNEVFSVGALTHQTWSDVDSQAGYWILENDSILHYETVAPKFVVLDMDVGPEDDETRLSILEGLKNSYIKVKTPTDDEITAKDIVELKDELIKKWGALGVIVDASVKMKVTREGKVVVKSESVIESINNWITDAKMKNSKLVLKGCDDVLRRLEDVS